MPFDSTTLPVSISCTTFVQAYPYPAFVLSKRHTGKSAAALIPIYSNEVWKKLIYGPKSDKPYPEHGGLLESIWTATDTKSIDLASQLGRWVETPIETSNDSYVLSLWPSWMPQDQLPVQLELVKTSLQHFWVITSIPRSTLPTCSDPPIVAPETPGNTKDTALDMKLPDFSSLSSNIQHMSESLATVGLAASRPPIVERAFEFHTPHDSELRRMMANFPWHESALGPQSQWPQSLKSVLSFVMASPFPMALWWGPELTVMYNDHYRDIAGDRHPEMFGQCGAVAWGELWNSLGSVTSRVLAGESVAKVDDLLFFDRLTEKKMPEEVYHSWHYVPVRKEDGAVGGFINGTIETTAKILAARRLLLLRDLGDKTVLAQTKKEYAEAVIKVLEKTPVDVPFAALYYSTVQAVAKHPTLGSAADTRGEHLTLTLQLAGSIGIPANDEETPEKMEVQLHPVSQRLLKKQDLSRKSSATRHIGPFSDTSSTSSSSSSTTSSGRPPSSLSDPASCASGTTIRESTPPDPTTSSSPNPQWPFFDAFGRSPVLHIEQLPENVVNTLMRRGWGDKPRAAVVIQISAEGDDVPSAILIMGINTRRPFDKDYRTWIDVIRVSLSSTLTGVMNRESEKLKAEQLAQLDAAKTNFFSSASHELRTPLTLISGPITDLLAEARDARAKEMLELASRNVSRLSRLVDSLMEFTRLEAGRLRGQFRPVELNSFTSDLTSLFRAIIEKNTIEFRVLIDVDNDQIVYVDPDLWEKIVFNLIGNAFKYTMSGSITVRIAYDDNRCRFIVEDTGVGIPEEDVGKIFDRFHRVASVARSHEGTGIGLALTRELVKLHGGEVHVKSHLRDLNSADASHGSTFTVSIPLGKDHLPREAIDETVSVLLHQRTYARGVVEEASHWISTHHLPDETTPTDISDITVTHEGIRGDSALFNFVKQDIIMLVDDNADIRTYIRSVFSRLCTVVEAANGQEALKMISTGPRPDLIISDVMMPVMDGFALLTALKERIRTQLIPVILLTAKAGEEQRLEGLLSGADDYVGKPFSSRELLARAHLQLQIGKRKREMQALFDQRTQEIRVLSDLSPVGIFRVDLKNTVTYTNHRWNQITQHSPDLPLSDWIQSVHPDDQPETSLLWGSCFDYRRGGSMDMRWKNGTWTRIQIEPLSNGMIATLTDISDRRLYEAAQLAASQERELVAKTRAADAEERQRESDQRQRAQELLVDVTSHELRQPVSAILNCSALVRSNLGELRQDLNSCLVGKIPFNPPEPLIAMIDDDLEALDAIYQCGLAQERIANDVLSLSRIQLQVLSIHPVDFDLVPEIRRILSIFSNELKVKAISLKIEFGQSIERYGVERVSADKARVAQVITNLISNAIKFTDASPPPRAICVNVEVSDKPPLSSLCEAPPLGAEEQGGVTRISPGRTVHIYIAVKDSGPGVQPDDLQLLFQRFQQGSNSHDVFGGSGLGLFVSRKLCDLMGGNIGVDSTYGEGATFRFYISATAVTPLSHEQREMEKSRAETRRFSRPTSKQGLRKLSATAAGGSLPPGRTAYHVLITEDNLINQTVLNRQLKQAGFTTALANNGEQAIQRIKSLSNNALDGNLHPKFDVILMDMEMPVMDGATAVREIRRMESTGELLYRNRIIALTGNARGAQVQSAREAGMDDVVIKPYRLESLIETIRHHVMA